MTNKKDQIPVTRGFLLKIAIGIIIFMIMTMLPLTFKVGGLVNGYSELSKISPESIKKAIKYSVDDQQGRKDFYRDWMKEAELKLQSNDSRTTTLETWSRDFKKDFTAMKKDVSDIQRIQAVNTRVLLSIDSRLNSYFKEKGY